MKYLKLDKKDFFLKADKILIDRSGLHDFYLEATVDGKMDFEYLYQVGTDDLDLVLSEMMIQHPEFKNIPFERADLMNFRDYNNKDGLPNK